MNPPEEEEQCCVIYYVDLLYEQTLAFMLVIFKASIVVGLFMLKTVGVWKCETWPLSIILDCCYSYVFFLFPDQGCHVV